MVHFNDLTCLRDSFTSPLVHHCTQLSSTAIIHHPPPTPVAPQWVLLCWGSALHISQVPPPLLPLNVIRDTTSQPTNQRTNHQQNNLHSSSSSYSATLLPLVSCYQSPSTCTALNVRPVFLLRRVSLLLKLLLIVLLLVKPASTTSADATSDANSSTSFHSANVSYVLEIIILIVAITHAEGAPKNKPSALG